ncbi:YbeD family protein [Thiohalophilus sp.]|uniref:HP0495 family protein n=1 Tax=Thiohalophilus sp. TaxID=3028392 RepID=UPI0039757778
MSQEETFLEFPCKFPIKVMGRSDVDLQSLVMELVSKHAPELREQDITRRDSRQGNYVSLTVTVTATSKAQLDRIYLELNASDAVLMTL